jgi:hypothetical protein
MLFPVMVTREERTVTQATIRAVRPGNSRRRPKTRAIERVCAAAECGTHVSRYNLDDFCFRHRPVKYPRLRGVFSDEFGQ